MIDVLCIHWRQFSSLLHASGEVWQFQCVLSELLLHVEHCFFFHTKRNSKYVLKSNDEHIMISTNLTFQIELILWKQHNVMDKLVVPGPQHHEKWSINTSKFIGQNDYFILVLMCKESLSSNLRVFCDCDSVIYAFWQFFKLLTGLIFKNIWYRSITKVEKFKNL